MARDSLPDFLIYQAENKIVRKGSICEFCNDLMKNVELKLHPISKERIIICDECDIILVKKLCNEHDS